MAKYHQVAEQVQRLIAERRLQPGDALPSERQLARELGVASGTVRLAYDWLFRSGLIDRHHGRGTFVADRQRTRTPAEAHRRIGLLAVEMRGYESPNLRNVTFDIQRLAREAGYELIVDQIDMEDLVAGKMPEMIRRQSIDGFFLYGRVREHHIRFLDEQPLPYLQVGNRPVPPSVPQVTIDAEGLAYQMTVHLLKANRSPIWIDVDPANISYETGQQLLRGYTRAMREAGASMNLCHLHMDRIDEVVAELLRGSLHNAAYIVQDWSASLLMSALSMRSADAEKLLLAPIPIIELCDILRSPNVLQWDRKLTVRDLTGPAVEQLLATIQGKQRRPRSVQLMMKVGLQSLGPPMSLSLQISSRTYEAEPAREPAPTTPVAPVGGWMP